MLRLAASTVQSHALVHLWFEADQAQVPFVDFVSDGPLSQVIANPLQPSNLVQVYASDRDAEPDRSFGDQLSAILSLSPPLGSLARTPRSPWDPLFLPAAVL